MNSANHGGSVVRKMDRANHGGSVVRKMDSANHRGVGCTKMNSAIHWMVIFYPVLKMLLNAIKLNIL